MFIKNDTPRIICELGRLEIERFLNLHEVNNYTIKDDNTIDVDGDVYLRGGILPTFHLPVNFDYVSGSFFCSHSEITTLLGCPTTVEGNFVVRNNRITDLQGAPREVGGFVDCSYNKELESLNGAPRHVHSDFSTQHCILKNLSGGPKHVGGHYVCSHNELTSLVGAALTVGGVFDCSNNQLTSLEHGPRTVEHYDCSYNKFKNQPKPACHTKIKGAFSYHKNSLADWIEPANSRESATLRTEETDGPSVTINKYRV